MRLVKAVAEIYEVDADAAVLLVKNSENLSAGSLGTIYLNKL